MITKVSYNAYASSANAMQRPNQPKNVTFGNTKVFEEFSKTFIPAHLRDNHMTLLFDNYECARLEVAVDFLKACKELSKSGVESIETALADLTLGHKNSSMETLSNRATTLSKLVELLAQHPKVSAKDMVSGVSEIVPFERLEQELSFMQNGNKVK